MLIWNPAAGRVRAEPGIQEAARVLEEAGWQVHLERSQSATHVTELARQAAQAQWEAVFAAGGDGTLGRATIGLAGSATALGVIPAGTTNVWAQEIGLPVSGPMAESVRRLAEGRTQTIDIGLCNGRPFFLWAGFGLDARVINHLERRRSRFMKQINEIFYALAILRCAAGWRGTSVQAQVDGQTVEGRFMLALAGNIRLYAGGLATLSPTAIWDDGKLELWLLKSGQRGGIGTVLRHLWNLGWGRHTQDREVVSFSFRQVKLAFETEEWMHMDGEPYGRVQAVALEVWEKALRVLIPKE